MAVRIMLGDCLQALAAMPDGSVHTVVTSPPYWGLRDYGVKGQIGLEPTLPEHIARLVVVFREVRRVLRKDGTLWLNYGDAYAGSWGAQSRGELPGPHSSISGGQIHASPKGSLTGSVKRTPGMKAKDRMLLPARLAIAMCDDGWWVRDEVIWHKPNPMPSSVKDRTTPAHEMLYMFAKSARYFYDSIAIAEPFSEASIARLTQRSIQQQQGGARQDEFEALGLNERGGSRRPSDVVKSLSMKVSRKPAGWDVGNPNEDPARFAASSRRRRPKDELFETVDPTPKRDIPHEASRRNSFARETKDSAGAHGQKPQHRADREPVSYDAWEGAARNKRSVWSIPTEAFPEAHFATFPTALVEPCVLAGTSARGACTACGTPWFRVFAGETLGWYPRCKCLGQPQLPSKPPDKEVERLALWIETVMPLCSALASQPTDRCRVLDPFGGSGTVALVAERLQRDTTLIELNPEYADIARARIQADSAGPLLRAEVETI